jgi:phosphoadenosine phosphosulfate reductase
MMQKELALLLEGSDLTEGLKRAAHSFTNAKFSTALGEEDQVLTHLISTLHLPIKIFTLDTGRLFTDTYDLLSLTCKHYNTTIQVYFPGAAAVEHYVHSHGVNGFYDSIENRKQCCQIRKVQPLKRALADVDLWITGVRGSQSNNRQQMKKVEWDEGMKLWKYNPLLDWSDDQVKRFIDEHKIPVNPLHKKGFASIGCAPCTRAILPGEDVRAGRWWWESSAKECGLHSSKELVPSKVTL